MGRSERGGEKPDREIESRLDFRFPGEESLEHRVERASFAGKGGDDVRVRVVRPGGAGGIVQNVPGRLCRFERVVDGEQERFGVHRVARDSGDPDADRVPERGLLDRRTEALGEFDRPRMLRFGEKQVKSIRVVDAGRMVPGAQVRVNQPRDRFQPVGIALLPVGIDMNQREVPPMRVAPDGFLVESIHEPAERHQAGHFVPDAKLAMMVQFHRDGGEVGDVGEGGDRFAGEPSGGLPVVDDRPEGAVRAGERNGSEATDAEFGPPGGSAVMLVLHRVFRADDPPRLDRRLRDGKEHGMFVPGSHEEGGPRGGDNVGGRLLFRVEFDQHRARRLRRFKNGLEKGGEDVVQIEIGMNPPQNFGQLFHHGSVYSLGGDSMA